MLFSFSILKRRRRKKKKNQKPSHHPAVFPWGLSDQTAAFQVLPYLTVCLPASVSGGTGDSKFHPFCFFLALSIRGSWFLEDDQICRAEVWSWQEDFRRAYLYLGDFFWSNVVAHLRANTQRCFASHIRHSNDTQFEGGFRFVFLFRGRP